MSHGPFGRGGAALPPAPDCPAIVNAAPISASDATATSATSNLVFMFILALRAYFFLEYWLGAPGVGTLPATCAPLSCARVNAVVRVMPVPETCAPAACASVSGAATVIEAPQGRLLPPPPPLPPRTEATTAVSWFAPLSMVMVWPAVKPAAPATGITVAPRSVAAPTVVAPGRANRRDDGGLEVRAGINHDLSGRR